MKQWRVERKINAFILHYCSADEHRVNIMNLFIASNFIWSWTASSQTVCVLFITYYTPPLWIQSYLNWNIGEVERAHERALWDCVCRTTDVQCDEAGEDVVWMAVLVPSVVFSLHISWTNENWMSSFHFRIKLLEMNRHSNSFPTS